MPAPAHPPQPVRGGPDSHLRNLAQQIFPHLLQQSQAQAQAQPPVPLPHLLPARSLSTEAPLAPPMLAPQVTISPASLPLSHMGFEDAMRKPSSGSPERKMSDASGSASDEASLPFSPRVLARYVSAWDPESVLRDKSKAVL